MKRLLLMCVLLTTLCGLNAQETHRWTLSLSLSPGAKQETAEDGYKLLPSIAYNFNSWLSVGVELNLPLEDRGVYSSTGAELFVSFHSPKVHNFRLTLSPVFGGSIIGAYKFSLENSRGIDCAMFPHRLGYLDCGGRQSSFLKHRWYVGLRPTLSYALSSRCSLSLSYAMWGYRSHSRLARVQYFTETGLGDKGEFGLTTSATYSSEFRLGFSYSF